MADTTLAILAIAVAGLDLILGGRIPGWAALAMRVGCLAVLSTVLGRLIGSPIAPHLSGPPDRHVAQQALAVAWWLMTARVAVTLVRLRITRGSRSRQSHIVSDLLAGAIYLGAVLASIAFVFAIPIRGLLATSGVIAIVLGLALQSTLGDVFSGIAVGVEHPYRVGDMVSIDGGTAGRVLQVNWRSTHLQVGRDVSVIPNSLVAKAKLLNRSAPSPVCDASVEVRVHPDVPIGHVLPVLRAALACCEHLAPGTGTDVTCTGVAGDGSTFNLTFTVASSDQVGSGRTEVLAQVHRHLYHARMPLAVAGQTPPPDWSPRPITAAELLARNDLFAGMPQLHRALLAEHLRPVELDEGETLFTAGGAPEAMFLLAAGTIEVRLAEPAEPARTHRLAPGETLGLVSLVNAQAYRMTAVALNPIRAFRLDRDALRAAITDTPGLAAELEIAVGRTLALISRLAAVDAAPETAQHGALLSRVRAFLARLR